MLLPQCQNIASPDFDKNTVNALIMTMSVFVVKKFYKSSQKQMKNVLKSCQQIFAVQ